MSLGSLRFTSGQALLDWLKETKQPLNPAKVTQSAMPHHTRPHTHKPVGLGFIPEEARHRFLVHVPKGSST
jgi:hypothetical protein